MANNRRQLMLQAQFKKAVEEPNEFVKYAFASENDQATWYVMLFGIGGNNDEFTDGEYLIEMKLPEKFPMEPPEFIFMTPNGLYDHGKKVCISIGEYHKADYRSALGARGFCQQLVSGLIGWKELGGGINVLKTSVDQKRKMAKSSREFNLKHYSDELKLVEDSFKFYSAKWDLSTVQPYLLAKLGLVCAPKTNTNDCNLDNKTNDLADNPNDTGK